MILYVIQCWNNFENFYKVGVTTEKTVEKRFNSTSKMPYSYKIIKTISGDSKQMLAMEYNLHSICRYRHYVPSLKFGGYKTECIEELMFSIEELGKFNAVEINHDGSIMSEEHKEYLKQLNNKNYTKTSNCL